MSAVHRPQRPWPEKKARAAERQVSRGTWRRAEGTELAFLAPSARLPPGASVYWPLRTSFKGPQVALRKRDAQLALPSAFAAGVLAPMKAVYCHPAYGTYMQSTSCEMLGWIKHKLESRFPGETAITTDMQMIQPLWQKAKRN